MNITNATQLKPYTYKLGEETGYLFLSQGDGEVSVATCVSFSDAYNKEKEAPEVNYNEFLITADIGSDKSISASPSDPQRKTFSMVQMRNYSASGKYSFANIKLEIIKQVEINWKGRTAVIPISH